MDDTPLCTALKSGDLATARALIEQGADVQAADSEGKVPLHYAAFLGARDIVELLIQHGADVNCRDRDGLTPLHWALHITIRWDRLADHLATAKVLFQAGADMKAQTYTSNQTAWEYVGYPEFVQLVEGMSIDAEMWHYVANIWDNRKRFEDALAAYQRARELAPRDSLSYYISPANILVALNRYEEALPLIEQAETLTLKPPLMLLERKAFILRHLGRAADALTTYQHSADLLPEDAQAWLEQGRILNELGRHDEALIALERASDLGTSELYDGWYVPHSVVEYLMEQGQYEDALRFIDRAIEHEPERLNSWTLKRQILLKLGRETDANAVEQWVTDHEPADAGHWYLKGEALDEFGQHEAAMAAFERACALGDELPYNWLIPSTISHLCMHKRYTEALPFFERTIEHDLTDMEIRMWYGRILAELGRREETLNVYQRVAEREPDYARAWHDQGHILRQLSRHEEAIAAYQKAVELEPHYISAWNNLGLSFNDLKRYEEALIAFRRANILKPNEAWYLYNMAWALDSLNRSEEALPLLERALEVDSTYVQSWRLKGKIFHKLERFAESIAAYEQALALDFNHAYAWNRYGLALSRLGRYDEGLIAFQRATQLDATQAYYWDNVAYALQMLKQYRAAVPFVDRALQCDPGYASALKRKAWFVTKLRAGEQPTSEHDQSYGLLLDLVARLASGDFRAIEALSQWGKLAVYPLIEALNNPHPAIPFRAANALGTLGDERAVKPLQRHLGSKDTSLGAAASAALGRLGEPGLAALLESIRDPKPNVRADAVYGFKNLVSWADDRVFEAFVAALDDSSDLVRMRAAESANDPRAIESLIDHLPNDIAIWTGGVWSLSQLGGPRVAAFFLAALNDQALDARLRQEIALTIYLIPDPKVIDVLLTALTDPNSEVRGRAVYALGELGDLCAIPHLRNLLSDTGTISHHGEKQRIRDWAAQALDKLRASDS